MPPTDLSNAIERARRDLTDAKNATEQMIGQGSQGLAPIFSLQKAAITQLDGLSNIHTSTDDMQRYALTGTVAQALGGAGTSLKRLISAAKNDQPVEVGAEVLNLAGSALRMLFLAEKASAWLGPWGMALGELLNALAAGLIEWNAGPQESIGVQLRNELAEFGGIENIDRLEGVQDSLARIRADLGQREKGSLSWDQVNQIGRFEGPDEVIWLGTAEHWLRRETRTEVWPLMFKTYAHVSARFLENLTLGLRALRKVNPDLPKAEQVPLADLKPAMAVTEEICTQYEDMVATFKPKASMLGRIWFVGSNEDLYWIDPRTQKSSGYQGDFGTKATAIALSSEGRRVWHLGHNHSPYSMTRPHPCDKKYRESESAEPSDQKIHRLKEKVDHLAIAKKTGSAQSHFVTSTEDGIAYRLWDESLPSYPKFAEVDEANRPFADGKPPMVSGEQAKQAFDGKISDLAVTGDGVVYFVRGKTSKQENKKDKAVRVLRGREVKHVAHENSGGPEATDDEMSRMRKIHGIATNSDKLFVYGEDKDGGALILGKGHQSILSDGVAGQGPWEVVPLDGLPERKARVTDLVANDDGVLAAVVNERMYAWCGCKKEPWRMFQHDTAKFIARYPVDGWQEFASLESLVNEMRETQTKLIAGERPPMLDVLPASPINAP